MQRAICVKTPCYQLFANYLLEVLWPSRSVLSATKSAMFMDSKTETVSFNFITLLKAPQIGMCKKRTAKY